MARGVPGTEAQTPGKASGSLASGAMAIHAAIVRPQVKYDLAHEDD